MPSHSLQHLSSRQYFSGYCLAVLAAVGFSTKAILVKLCYAYPVDATTLLALRMLFSVPVFLLIALRHGWKNRQTPLSRADKLAVLLLGLSGYYLSSLLDFMGLQYISASLERLILFLYPTFVVLISMLFLGKPCGKKELLALLLSYAGIVVVFYAELNVQAGQLWLGAGLVFASTLSFAAYLIGTGQIVARIGTSRFTAYAMLVASVATVLQFAFTHPWQALLVPKPVYEYSMWMALIATVLPVFMLSAAINRIGSSRASLIGSLGPVATLCMANQILGEALTLVQMAGLVLVMAGVLSLSRR
ncbi:EamA family transporter [Methylomonas paludis]|uniref:EamA family transporter n=1 Tax=Methylomonas paludis TaxID=1173101 RepID=A0A975RAM4_9GAMM|nr:DMT family transporter [Methylomonas paludis]QWF72302.1 EamA family transporter [Methylomonas paludis]